MLLVVGAVGALAVLGQLHVAACLGLHGGLVTHHRPRP